MIKWRYRTEQQGGKCWKAETCTREKHRKKKRWMKDHRAEVKGFICRTISRDIIIRPEFSPRFLGRVRGDGDRGHAEGILGHPTALETRLEPRQNHKLVNPKNFK